MSDKNQKATVIEPPAPEPEVEEAAGPIVAGELIEVEGHDAPVKVRFRRDLGRLVLPDGTTVFEKDVTRA